jgi:hypothetical protein
MFANGNMEPRRSRELERKQLGPEASFRKGVEPGRFRGGEVIPHYVQADEETPLLRSLRIANYSDSIPGDEGSQMSQETDKVFGPWPGRLANPYVGFILSLHSIH